MKIFFLIAAISGIFVGLLFSLSQNSEEKLLETYELSPAEKWALKSQDEKDELIGKEDAQKDLQGVSNKSSSIEDKSDLNQKTIPEEAKVENLLPENVLSAETVSYCQSKKDKYTENKKQNKDKELRETGDKKTKCITNAKSDIKDIDECRDNYDDDKAIYDDWIKKYNDYRVKCKNFEN